ncbi:MAG: c-type cytochrome domain-containing protein, partial [Pirellulaceae bacterium]
MTSKPQCESSALRCNSQKWNRYGITLRLSLCVLVVLVQQTSAYCDVSFEQDIAPIFEKHCLRCHYPGNEKGEFSIATFDSLRENEYVSPGDSEDSYLIDLVSSHGGEPAEMPLEGEPLSAEQVATLKAWIDSGAAWPDAIVIKHKPNAGADWWAFQPVPQNEVSTDPAAVDRLIDAELAERGLNRNPAADRRELIIRAT